MSPFGVDLRAAVAQRWGDDAARGRFLDLDQALAGLAEEPLTEPGAWPPPLPPARAPFLEPPEFAAGGDPTEAGIAALASPLQDGRITAEAVVAALLERSRRLDPALRVWAYLDEERAHNTARLRSAELRAGERRGVLHGVPIAAKDIFQVSGMPTRANSAILPKQPSNDDGASVALLRRAGAIILGKTATTEFAFADPSAARNPWNPAHTPGGSSSGSAAGVAARLFPGALGSQTSGSVLRPAAFCGVVGFKPGIERISRSGVIPLAWSLDHVGTLTRSVVDAAWLYKVMTGAAWDGAGAPRPPRIGLDLDFQAERTDEESRQTLRMAARALEQAGASIQPIDLAGFSFGERAMAAHTVIMASEVAAYHLGDHPDRLGELGPRLRSLIHAGSVVPAEALLRARGERAALSAQVAEEMSGFDALLVPAAPGTAPEGLDSTGDPSLNGPWSLVGTPAIALPIALAANGLPLAMQLVAPVGQEDRLLSAAWWCERVIGFGARPPL